MRVPGGGKLVIFKKGEDVLLQNQASFGQMGSGTLFLTNQRIVFEKQTGLLSKKTEMLLDLDLGDVQDVKVEGFMGKKLVIEADLSGIRSSKKQEFSEQFAAGQMARCEFKIPNPQGWETQIRSAVADI